jgi:pentapeptide MXKDX repeat protein
MNKKSFTALSVAILVLAGGTSAYSAEPTPKSSQASKEAMKKEAMKKEAMKKAEAKKKAEAMKKDAMKKEADKMGMIKGSYSDYDASKLSNAEHGTVILFFNATWCPTCVAANKNFNGSTPPDGLTLLKVDYDDSTDLKRKYGVTYQHTFVQVDKSGKLLKKWNGSNTYDELISNKA